VAPDPAVGEHHDPLRHARGDIQVVGHGQGRDLLLGELREEAAQEVAARERVEAGEALVQQEQAWRLAQRGHEQRARGLAAREGLEASLQRDLPLLGEARDARGVPARVLVLADGRIKRHGTLEEILESDEEPARVARGLLGVLDRTREEVAA